MFDPEPQFRAGHYSNLLSSTEGKLESIRRLCSPDQQLMIAQVLIHADRIDEALQIIDSYSSHSVRSVQAHCELLLGLIAKRKGELDLASRRFQSAIRSGRETSAFYVAAWSHLHLFRLLAERGVQDELAALLAEARTLVTRIGDPHLVSYLHLAVALKEAQAGRTHEARRHLGLALSVLKQHPNAWIEQLAHINAACVASLDCDFRTALSEIGAARDLSKATGESYQDPIIDANEAHFELSTGRLTSAYSTFGRLSSNRRTVVKIAALDGLARLYLCLNHLDECEDLLRNLALLDINSGFYTLRWVAHTRVALLVRNGETAAAIRESERALNQARKLCDTPLTIGLTLLRAEAFCDAGLISESAEALLDASEAGAMVCRDQQGNYHETCHRLLFVTGQASFGQQLRRRALRIWRAEGNISSQLAILGRSTSSLPLKNYSQSAIDRMVAASRDCDVDEDVRSGFLVANAIAAAFDLSASPNLAAIELNTAAAALGCQHIVKFFEYESTDGGRNRVALASQLNRPLNDVSNAVVVADLLRIAKTVSELGDAREEERRRAALWPHETNIDADGLFLSDDMVRLAATAKKVAATTVPVLITGETGTGKEILARAIHRESKRANAAFLPFNCSAGPREMIDAQLFGHRRGAFTGASEHAPGVIRAAAGGTLFLDEIGESPIDVQPKLLRFLESGEVHPVGEAHPAKVDVRVIAATNVDLDAAVCSGRFREDLFYRLNIVRLHVPPLRQRRVEIPVFALHYLRKHTREFAKGDLRLAEETMEYLVLYSWPGNVRQLANEMRRLAALAETDAVLMPEHLSPEIVAGRRTVPASERPLDANEIVVRLDQPMAAAAEHLERAIIPWALKQSGGRVEEAARMLGLSRKGLYLKRQRLGLDPPEQHVRTA